MTAPGYQILIDARPADDPAAREAIFRELLAREGVRGAAEVQSAGGRDMSRHERIEDVKGLPTIGRHYLVPCVGVRAYGFGPVKWVPVIGPEHDDREYIGLDVRHWHYDWRFARAPLLESGVYGRDQADWPALIIQSEHVVRAPQWLRRRCIRQAMEFPLAVTNWEGKTIVSPFARNLEDAYADVKLKPGCRTCPHRGMPLNGLPKKDGVVICPGHGLAWNLRTGEMVRRVPIVAQAHRS